MIYPAPVCLAYLYLFNLGVNEQTLDNPDATGYTLLLPGKRLDISAIIKAKKFKHRGNKSGALEACNKLQLRKDWGNCKNWVAHVELQWSVYTICNRITTFLIEVCIHKKRYS